MWKSKELEVIDVNKEKYVAALGQKRKSIGRQQRRKKRNSKRYRRKAVLVALVLLVGSGFLLHKVQLLGGTGSFWLEKMFIRGAEGNKNILAYEGAGNGEDAPVYERTVDGEGTPVYEGTVDGEGTPVYEGAVDDEGTPVYEGTVDDEGTTLYAAGSDENVPTQSEERRSVLETIIEVFSGKVEQKEHVQREVSQSSMYPEELLELAEKNEEALDFVREYPNREKYMGQPIDLSRDYQAGEVPLLMQWDKRWGYDRYGDGMIALEGCGPTCLSMAYLYFTGDTKMNPRKMAEFAYNQGFYSTEGTCWSLWTEGVRLLGLYGKELSLSEASMKEVLDAGGLIVCSMRPGDFTTTGHYILIYDYDEQGFRVHDPNRRSNSEKQWEYETLSGQIKNLWGLSMG